MFCVSISLVLKPEVYSRGIYNKTVIEILGGFFALYLIALIYSLFQIYLRKYAFLIADDFFIDNSRYESLGKIDWKNINEVQKIKKNSLQLNLNKNVIENSNMNLIQKFLSIMKNWNYKDSIIVSTTLTQISRDKLLDEILNVLQNQKNYS